LSNEDEIVLVVDDSPDTVSMLTDALEQESFSVLVALSGNQALSILRKVTPDVILMDAMMPGKNGFETCREIRQDPSLEDIPVIFMTGLDSQSHMLESFRSGAVDYIQKPLRISELVERIRYHVAKARELTDSRALLDSSGMPCLMASMEGTVRWATPGARSTLENAGISHMDLFSELQPKLRAFLRSAKVGSSLRLGQAEIVVSELRDNDQCILQVRGQKSPDEACSTLRECFGLTAREAEVLYWTSQGKSNKEMAIILGISPRTVNKHLETIFSKMMVDNRTAAANMALGAVK
jgi:DNA-binding response OmpR family regulator/DNA-binding CsgD family transcriptional regulator